MSEIILDRMKQLKMSYPKVSKARRKELKAIPQKTLKRSLS